MPNRRMTYKDYEEITTKLLNPNGLTIEQIAAETDFSFQTIKRLSQVLISHARKQGSATKT